ncbi:MAG TPA: transcription termination/antitermination protein NusA [Candidatus Pullichristensenella stercorigallinarum]|uniref:Transcription termination/antitermination protein NusA n=1 Tax=Candidatus Pullichristensenella stercorigallinarum TaxID=2840909 RepID=A0A9D0ZPE3_9FIRM|nr:transcription termination/antitermination protein NusA [Candidatus Pullichristensenella stercorigallinarum]
MANSSIDSRELISAVNDLSKERRVNKDVLFAAIEAALISAYKKNYGKNANVRAAIDRERGEIEVLSRKTVVDEVNDPQCEMTIAEAREIDRRYELGDLVEVPVTPRDFGRIAAQTAKQVVVQHLREAERGVIYDEYSQKENEILTAIVQRVENRTVYVELGRTEGIIEPNQQMPNEELNTNDRIKVYVLEVSRQGRGPQVYVSRTHPGLVKRLFELEVPELVSGVVQIKSIAREAGFRTKMAVFSTDPLIDAVGSCVGPRGMRVENVVSELKTEKIDIIKWSADPAEYIANALNPARVISVFTADGEKSARVIVPDNQLSLAIGKEGQNARLAAKLTGWKIDIKSQSQVEAMIAEGEAEAETGAMDPSLDDGFDLDADLDLEDAFGLDGSLDAGDGLDAQDGDI